MLRVLLLYDGSTREDFSFPRYVSKNGKLTSMTVSSAG